MDEDLTSFKFGEFIFTAPDHYFICTSSQVDQNDNEIELPSELNFITDERKFEITFPQEETSYDIRVTGLLLPSSSVGEIVSAHVTFKLTFLKSRNTEANPNSEDKIQEEEE